MQGGKRTVLVTAFMMNGDLFAALQNFPTMFTWARLGRRIALNIADGLAFLHSCNVCHFDIKSANILLDHCCNAKLADVGLAKILTNYHGNEQLSTFMATGELGTFAWAAPEVCLSLVLFSRWQECIAGEQACSLQNMQQRWNTTFDFANWTCL